jgi:hypothetical protein
VPLRASNEAIEAQNKNNFDGRHVGLDFYDLLIEARYPSN